MRQRRLSKDHGEIFADLCTSIVVVVRYKIAVRDLTSPPAALSSQPDREIATSSQTDRDATVAKIRASGSRRSIMFSVYVCCAAVKTCCVQKSPRYASAAFANGRNVVRVLGSVPSNGKSSSICATHRLWIGTARRMAVAAAPRCQRLGDFTHALSHGSAEGVPGRNSARPGDAPCGRRLWLGAG